MLVHRGQHRFRAPLDYRYKLYPLPSVADVKCPKCGERCAFAVAPREAFIQDAQSGGHSLLALSIEGPLAGVGACASCSNSFATVQWPNDAYFSVSVHGGTVWAWNHYHLAPLRARVAGERVQERQILQREPCFSRYLARLPKCAVIKRNREPLLRTLDRWLKSESLTLSRRLANRQNPR